MTVHIPVLSEEVLQGLALRAGQTVVDGTLGGGGHARRLADAVGTEGRVILMDRDEQALERARPWASQPPFELLHANFAKLPEALEQLGMETVDAILLDLGLSSDQLADGTRGFSFTSDGTLDLRFDIGRGEPACDLLARIGQQELADLIYQYGEERLSRRIARKIVLRRAETPIRSARQLAELVASCVPHAGGKRSRIHPATRTFQALRIAVNDELGALERALERFADCLNPGGRLAIISFHSLEDRRVKLAFRDDPRWLRVTRKAIQPSEEEVALNPRSRSARLRIAERRIAERRIAERRIAERQGPENAHDGR